MGRIIGIDLGTSNTIAAIMEGGQPVVIRSAEGDNLTPSVVAIDSKSQERLVGRTARNQAILNPENTIYSIKRFMGRKFSDPTIQEAFKHLPYKVSESPNGDVLVTMGGKQYSPVEISAMILRKIKMDAEVYLGEEVDKAVITVPAYFHDGQRNATKDAGRIAGLEVLRIINEPTAACLAYGLEERKNEIVAVYHLGGGTFDISIMEIGNGVFEVRSTIGDTSLGGDNFDEVIVDWVANEFRNTQHIDLRPDRQALQRLKEASERAKIDLSSVMTTEINLPFISVDINGSLHLHTTLSRSQLENMTKPLIDRMLLTCEKALQDAGIAKEEVNTVLIVGGMTRMPAVQGAFRSFFGRKFLKSVNLEEAVAMGAAIQAGVFGGEIKDLLLLDVTPLTLSVETLGGVATPMIERNTTIPTKRSQVFSTAADGQTQIELHIVQGERPMAADNKSLGKFILDGIPPSPKGKPQIEVTLDIDANGILNVWAVDNETKREQKVTITANTGVSEAELQRMIYDAEKYAADDFKRKAESQSEISPSETQIVLAEILPKGIPEFERLEGAQNQYTPYGVQPAQQTKHQQARPTIFISYAHTDGHSFAKQLDVDLRDLGFNTWWDNGIPPGSEWENIIRQAIDRSNAMVVVFTNAAAKSRYVASEWHYALDDRKISVVPLLLPDFDFQLMPLVLRMIQYLDLRNSDYQNTLKRLNDMLQQINKDLG